MPLWTPSWPPVWILGVLSSFFCAVATLFGLAMMVDSGVCQLVSLLTLPPGVVCASPWSCRLLEIYLGSSLLSPLDSIRFDLYPELSYDASMSEFRGWALVP